MARRRTKKRTHIGASNGNQANSSKSIDRTPKSMVIRIGAGEVGPSITQLVQDMRQALQPDTAIRLKERKNNKLRDYTTMCGPLGVTHLLLFSRSETGNTNLRIAITPRGPTLHFRVENYSLCKDIARMQRRPKSSKDLYLKAPLLVMNNFSSSTTQSKSSEDSAVPKHLESLVTTIFQSIFPPLNPQNSPLSSIKRTLLLNREPPSDPSNNAYTISLRHYAISTRTAGLTRPIKRLSHADKADKNERRGRGIPNLSRMNDVSEFLLGGENGTNDGNYTSASESETDTDGEVEVLAPRTKELLSRKKREKIRVAGEEGGSNERKERSSSRSGVEKRAVKLTELGPRMRLRLIKVEEGLAGGKVMWHDNITKTKAEMKEQEARWEEKRKAKEERKRVQKANVERKKKEKEARKGKGGKAEDEDSDDDDEMDYDISDDEYWQDVEDGDIEEDDEDEDVDMEAG